MSGAAVVIIIGGGTQQNRTSEAVEEIDGKIHVRVRREDGESLASCLRRAAEVLDGVAP